VPWPCSAIPTLISPRGDINLQPGDEVLAVLHRDGATEVAALLGEVVPP
jgi:Trk K+ transport system NAD-binding subunit